VTCSCARPGGTPLLTAAQEVELAKRIDRADMESKQRMVESNLRLVVSMRKLGLTRRVTCSRPELTG
jgi:RNA polymerase primary sigma factor